MCRENISLRIWTQCSVINPCITLHQPLILNPSSSVLEFSRPEKVIRLHWYHPYLIQRDPCRHHYLHPFSCSSHLCYDHQSGQKGGLGYYIHSVELEPQVYSSSKHCSILYKPGLRQKLWAKNTTEFNATIGYHVDKNIWTPRVRDIFQCSSQEDSPSSKRMGRLLLTYPHRIPILFLHEMKGTGNCSSYREIWQQRTWFGNIPAAYIFAGCAKDTMKLKKLLTVQWCFKFGAQEYKRNNKLTLIYLAC